VRAFRAFLTAFMGVGLLLAAMVALPAAASANPTCYTSGAPGVTTQPGDCATVTVPPQVLGSERQSPPAAGHGDVLAATVHAQPSSLAFTGSDVAGTVAIALLALGAGILLVRISHRRTA